MKSSISLFYKQFFLVILIVLKHTIHYIMYMPECLWQGQIIRFSCSQELSLECYRHSVILWKLSKTDLWETEENIRSSHVFLLTKVEKKYAWNFGPFIFYFRVFTIFLFYHESVLNRLYYTTTILFLNKRDSTGASE